jgi:alpha-galactosidase
MQDHWAQDAAVWAEWGVDWVKQDWCNTQGEAGGCADVGRRKKLTFRCLCSGMDIKKSYQSMSSSLNATGRKIHFNMCEWGLEAPWTWGDSMAQAHTRTPRAASPG